MESNNQIEGIVIRSYPSGESDLVLHVLSPDLGKMSLFAKHARKSHKRFCGNIEVFDRGCFSLKRGKGNLPLVDLFQPRATLYSVREDLGKLTAASVICEAFDLVLKEGQDDEETSQEFYRAISMAFAALEESSSLKETCRVCFLTLNALMSTAGFLDGSEHSSPTLKNLLNIITRIEHCVERELQSRPAFESILLNAKKTNEFAEKSS